MLNLMRKIKPFPLAAVLFTCVVLLSSAAAFADSGSVPELALSDIYPLNSDPVYDRLADGSRAVHDVNDVYLLLYDDIRPALRGAASNSVYSLPQIAYRINQFYSDFVDGMGPNGYGFFEQASDSYNVIQDDLPLIYSSLQQVHADGQNNTYYLQQINNKLSNDIPWSNYGTFVGCSTGLNNSYLSSNISNTTLYYTFNPSSASDQPSIFYFDLPSYISSDYYTSDALNAQLQVYFTNSTFSWVREFQGIKYSVEERDSRFLRVYIYNLPVRELSYNFTLKLTTAVSQSFQTSGTSAFKALPCSSEYYFSVLDSYYIEHLDSDIHSAASDLNSLASYLANPDKIAAEDASQAVIDDTLDGFTGSGSAAAKTSDTGSLKNMSGSIQSGLDSGASPSNAASVFSNQTFWSWFTQSTSNGINTPYPAPVVQNSRGSGDDVPDFLSGNQAELTELLNQRNSW